MGGCIVGTSTTGFVRALRVSYELTVLRVIWPCRLLVVPACHQNQVMRPVLSLKCAWAKRSTNSLFESHNLNPFILSRSKDGGLAVPPWFDKLRSNVPIYGAMGWNWYKVTILFRRVKR
jgi:hypothetical protein